MKSRGYSFIGRLLPVLILTIVSLAFIFTIQIAEAAYSTAVSNVDPGWSNNRQKVVFHNGYYFFLLYTDTDGNIYYKSSTDNSTWSGPSTLVSDQHASALAFDIHLVNDAKFDLAYINPSGEPTVVTCDISGSTITPGTGFAITGDAWAYNNIAVARSGGEDRIYVFTNFCAIIRLWTANQTGDVDNITSWTKDVDADVANECLPNIAMVPYQDSDKVLIVYTKSEGGSSKDGVYYRVITAGGGAGTEVEVGNFGSLPDISSPISISDTDFRIIIRQPGASALEEWTFNGSTWSQLDANIDPSSGTNFSNPSLFYDRISGDMHVFSVLDNTTHVKRHYKPYGGSWQAAVDADAGLGLYSYPITQRYDTWSGGPRELVWAYRAPSTGFDLWVGNLGLGPGISSDANQVFAVGQAATPISPITITEASSPSITLGNDLRIRIVDGVDMVWDTSDTTATFTGTASTKVSNPVSYDPSGKILIIPVDQNFAADDTLIIEDLSFTTFNSTNAAKPGLQVFLDGPSDTGVDATDDKTITITAAVTLADHTLGQVADKFAGQTESETTTEYFQFQLDNDGERASSTLTVDLSSISGVFTGDLVNPELWADVNGDGLVTAATAWSNYATTESEIFGYAFDYTHNVLYAGATNGIIFRCETSTGCNEFTDWTTSYDSTESQIRSLLFDYERNVIYAGSNGTGYIYRCETSTGCDEDADWTTASDPTASSIYSFALDQNNNVIYAVGSGSSDNIIRCDTSTGCDEDADWSRANGAGITFFSLTFDSTNSVVYAGNASGYIYRCDTTSNTCINGDGWTSYDTGESNVYSLTFDATNDVLYAGTGSAGVIYRCDISTGCDAFSDWTISYDTPDFYIWSFTFDSNNILYAGTGSGDNIYSCDTSTGCDAAGDWTSSYTAGGDVRALTFDSANNVIYGGDGLGYILRKFKGDYRVFQSDEVSWTTSYDTPESTIGSLTYDSTNEVIYAGTAGTGDAYILRCETSTGCKAAGDWTTSLDTTEFQITSLTFDSANNVIYAGSYGEAIIYRCDTATGCDETADWTTSYDTTETYIRSLAFDSANNVIYAGSNPNGIIYRCDTSTGCDVPGEWTQSYDTGATDIYSLTFDSANNAIYAGSTSGNIYRCDTSTGCDVPGEWSTIALANIWSLTFDSANNVIYAGSTSGDIYRCDTSTGCDLAGEWTLSYNTSETFIYSLTFDSANSVIYAGATSGIVYRCDTSTGCDADADWTTTYDTTETRIQSLTFDSTHGVVYAGSTTNGIIFRGDSTDGIVNINGATGTIAFNPATILPAGTMDYLLRATIIHIADGDTITFDLSPSGVVATGEVSGESLTVSDSSTDPLASITHTRGAALNIFGFRKSITIDRTKIPGTCGTTLSNFPMLFSVTDGDLKTTANGGDVASYDAPTNDPRDIIFRALDDDTCGGPGTAPCGLYHEIEDYDETTGELVAWVKIPSVNTSAASSDTVIYIYYGNSDVTSSSQNANGVWDSNYSAVWHLDETSGDHADSTSNNNIGTPYGGVNQNATGQIDGADDFDGSNGEVRRSNAIIGDSAAFTITAWFKWDETSVDQRTIYSEGDTTTTEYLFLYVDDTENNVRFYSVDSVGNYAQIANGTTNVKDNQFHHVAMVQRSKTDRQLYVDTVSQGTDIRDAGTLTLNTASIGYLRTDWVADPFEGIIDEVRISNIDRNACWIAAEYNNQIWPDKAVTPIPDPSPNPDSGFYTLGGEEVTPATAVSLASFTAKGQSSSVLVEWETAQELNHMGFYLYRAKSPWGPFTRLTDKLISGLSSSVVGRKYSFEDKDVTPGEIYYYQLEDIDIYGKKTLHGPICVDWDGDGLPDDWEIAHGLNPGFDDADLDWDDDGLTNLQEYLRGTDPFNPDTDGDGILDGDEGVERDPNDQKISATLGPGVYLVSSDEKGITLELRTDTFDFDIVQAEGQEFERLRIKDYIHGFTDEVGKPELPLKGILVDIPDGFSATLTVLETESEVHTGYRIYPVPETVVDDQGELSHVGETFTINEAAYSIDAFYPDAPALLGKEYLFRGQQKQQIFFYPLTFNPATGELRHLRRIRVRVDYVDAGAVTTSGPEPTVWKPPVVEELSVDSFSMVAAAAWEPPSEASPVYKILVLEEGIYRLTRSWLEARGVNVATIDLSQVRIYNLGEEIAISVYDENSDTQFDPEDYIDFYGRAVDDTYAKYTNNNVYWLTLEGGVGAPKRMAEIGSTPVSVDVPSTHSFSVHHEEDRRYWAKAPGDDSLDRYFFEPYLYGEEIDYAGAGDPVPFNLFLPGVSGTAKGTLKIMMAGTWAPDHQVAVSLNGTSLGTYSWSDIAFYEATIEGVDLLDGMNTVTLQCLTGVDAIAVDWFEVTYPRSFESYGDSLRFSHETGYRFQVSGFTTDTLLAFDITSPDNVEKVVNFDTIDAGGPGPYTLDFEPESAPGERTYLILTSNQVKTPTAISEDVYGNLANPALGADFILITHRDIGWDVSGDPYPWLTDLVSLRQAQGLRVKVVDVEDVFDEFSYGIESPEAIRDVITYAYTSWTQPAPQYVLLVGDSTRNPKNNPDPTYGLDSVTTYIPAYLTFTEHNGESATDEWFVRVSGDDGISDLYIGRLPAKSAAEATSMVNKILAYEGSINTKSWEKNVLLLADDQRDGPEYEYEATFELMNNDVEALLPQAMNDPFKGYLNDYFDADDLSAEIIAHINNGTLMVNYSGHSSVQILANHKVNYENILNNTDVATLTNSGMYPLFVGMGCLSGNFLFPEGWNFPSLAEALLRAEDKGAAAALMSTGQTTTEGQHILDSALFDAIFNQDIRMLGPAVSSAKQTLMANGDSTYEEVYETFLLFGDPAMTLKVPLPRRPENLSAQGNTSGVSLSWNGSTNCNGEDVDGYNLYRSTTPGGPYTKVNTSLVTGTQYDDTIVSSTMAQYSSSAAASSGTTYYYVVTSVDTQGDESVYSQEASGGTQSANPSASESSSGGGGGCFINTVAGN